MTEADELPIGKTKLLTEIDSGKVVSFRGVDLVHAQIDGQTVMFAVDFKRDPIQRSHRNGLFFERSELDALQEYFPKNGTFVDIGANVGNHSLFAALFLKAKRVIPFEPNQRVYRLLVANVLLNRLGPVFDLSNLGLGVGEYNSDTFGLENRDVNLGATKLLDGEGAISVRRGDDLLMDESPDCIKVDVEGMEMSVLRGLDATITRCQPIIMIEVPNEHEPEFQKWLTAKRYQIVSVKEHYKVLTNYLLVSAKS